jgi:hypothetical protein
MIHEEIVPTLSAVQERVSLLLAAGVSVHDASTQCDCGERTIHTWLSDPEFRALVNRHRSKLVSAALGQLIDAAGQAIATLRACLGSAQDSVRVRAAVAVLDKLVQIRDTTEFDERLTELEKSLGKQQQRSTWKARPRAGRR